MGPFRKGLSIVRQVLYLLKISFLFLSLTTPMQSLLGVPSSKKPSQDATWLRLWRLSLRQPGTVMGSWLAVF